MIDVRKVFLRCTVISLVVELPETAETTEERQEEENESYHCLGYLYNYELTLARLRPHVSLFLYLFQRLLDGEHAPMRENIVDV